MRNFMRLETPMLFLFAFVVGTQASCSADSALDPGPPVAAVTVALDVSMLSVGHTAQASATVKDSAGNAIDGQTVSWASLDSGVAKVSAEGTVMAVAAGSTVIEGKISGKIGGAELTVVGPANLAFHDFNDGTRGPFTDYGVPSITYPDDPTGSGRGKVCRILYSPGTPASGVVSSDQNMEYNTVHQFRYGETLWFKGDVYIPSTLSDGVTPKTAAQNNDGRKLVDLGQRTANGARFVLFRREGSRELYWMAGDYMNGGVYSESYQGATGVIMNDDTWYTIEIMMRMNSADNVRDGILEVYVNNPSATPTLRITTGLGWISEAFPGGSYLGSLRFGTQLTIIFPETSYSEYRYWDNVGYSTTRIGQ